MSIVSLEKWLSVIQHAHLECDGMSRCVSALLRRNNISHSIHIGELDVAGVGKIRPHFWIAFPEGAICDFRAQMWLGCSGDVPNGVFIPTAQQQYIAYQTLDEQNMESFLFEILTGIKIDSIDPYVDN